MIENEDKVLEVKNLRISFKTNGGTVKAVRGINFSLYKKRVLAIVGESGSGKSVTSKAILGILANNKIIEDGQIIFEGKDLLKISEEQFTKIRGVKISMIFQDPLSSLNPIMKVGKQLTEAMVLKSKATVRNAKKNIKRFDETLSKVNAKGFKEVKDYAESLKKGDKDFAIDNYHSFFMEAVKEELVKQENNLSESLRAINDFNNLFFSDDKDYSNVDLKKLKNELKRIDHLLKKSLFSLATDSDDVIEVYVALMRDYLADIKESIILLRKREEILKKNNVDDIYKLPASIRAKLREVILTPHQYYSSMKNLTSELIEHIQALLSPKDEHVLSNIASNVAKFYFTNAVDAKSTLSNSEGKTRAIELLKEVGIPEPERRYEQYPFEFSGGMRQRIVIAIALSSNPEVLICDEPTTALDVTIQAQILELINKLKVEKNLSIIFITHDLGVVANMADDIAVMYAGKIVEYGTVFDIFYDPRHPYTWALLGSMPDLKTKEKLNAIPGTPPNMLLPPKGDAFALRNQYALEEDFEEQPPFFKISDTHYAATWLLHPLAPDVEAPKIVYTRIYESLKDSNFKNCPHPDNYKNSVLKDIGGNK